MNKWTKLFCIFLACGMLCQAEDGTMRCEPGTFLYIVGYLSRFFCIECPGATFMPDNNHQNTACIPCDEVREPELEILISPCNKTHAAVIHCVDGYYRDEARNPRETHKCRKCTQCPRFTGRPCGTYRDTVCCWNENDDVVSNDNGVSVCRERPWFCERGQYFDTRAYYCLPCPDNTFMPLDYHIQTECWKCNDESIAYRPLHSVIVQPCNSTHAPVIRCEDGFFIKSNMGYRDDATGCSPCTDCSTKTDVQYEGRKCDGMEDTVCCPQPNMTVQDTPKGPVCCPEPNMTVHDTLKGPVCCPEPNMSVQDTPQGPVCCPESNMTIHDTSKGPFCCPQPNMSVSDTPNGPVCCPESNMIVQDTPEGFVCCPHDNMIVVDTPDGLDSRDSASPCHPGQCLHHDSEERSPKCGPCSFNVQLDEANYQQLPILAHVLGVTVSFMFGILLTVIFMYRKQILKVLQSFLRRVICLGDRAVNYRQAEAMVIYNAGIPGNHEEELVFIFVDRNRAHFLCHDSSIPTKDFDLNGLPQHCLGKRKTMECVKAISNLTVRLSIGHVSRDRPENDHFQAQRELRFASGLVYDVLRTFEEDDDLTCPCKSCLLAPQSAKTSWGEFLVVTTTQIGYDDTECQQTSCKVWLDDDEDLHRVPSLEGRQVKKIDGEQGICELTFVSHDVDICGKLQNMISRMHFRSRKHKPIPTDANMDIRTAIMISHPHGLGKKISLGEASLKREEQTQKWTLKDFQICKGCVGAPVCLLGQGIESGFLTVIYTGRNECTEFDMISK